MPRKFRISPVTSAALLAILTALGSVSAMPESFAQEKQLTTSQRYNEGFNKIQEQDYENGLKILEKLKAERGDRLSATQNACIDFLRAAAYYNLKKWDEAATILRDFPILYPKGIGENNNRLATSQTLLAHIYVQQGKWEEAREQLLKVSKIPSISQADLISMEIVHSDLIRKEAEATKDPEMIKNALSTSEQRLKTAIAKADNIPEAAKAQLRLAGIYFKQNKSAEAATQIITLALGVTSGFGGTVAGAVAKGKGMGIGNRKSSPFGSLIGGNRVMKGYLFDLKQDKQGTALATTEGGDNDLRKEQLRKALGILDTGGWQLYKLQNLYFQAPTTLYSPRVFIVNEKGQALNANLTTVAFADEKTGKAPFKAPGWLCYYEGSFRVPEDGEYRFVGMADDAMLVGVDRQTVLYAYRPGEGFGPAVKYREGWEPKNHCGKGGTDGKNLSAPGLRSSLYKGHWLKLKANRYYRIQIAFGDASGMTAGACLGIQRKGCHDDDNFPMFSLQGSDGIPEWGISGTGRYNLSENYRIPAR